MKHFKPISIIALGLLLAACSNYRPIVDTKGVDMYAYDQDLRECQSYAEQVNPAGQAVVGALAGAALGATVGVIAGDSGRAAATGAALGGVAGGVGAGAHGGMSQRDIIRRCMAGRGYRVLD